MTEERKEIFSLIMKIEFLSFFIGDIFAIALFGLASIAGKNGMNETMEALFALGLILMFVGIGGTAVSNIIGKMLEKKWKFIVSSATNKKSRCAAAYLFFCLFFDIFLSDSSYYV